MKVVKVGIILKRSDGTHILSGWDVEELEGISTNPAVALSNLNNEQKAELVRQAKENNTYIESDILKIEDVLKLIPIRDRREINDN